MDLDLYMDILWTTMVLSSIGAHFSHFIKYLIRTNFSADKFSRIFTQNLYLREVALKLVPNISTSKARARKSIRVQIFATYFANLKRNSWTFYKTTKLAKFITKTDLWKMSNSYMHQCITETFFTRFWFQIMSQMADWRVKKDYL